MISASVARADYYAFSRQFHQPATLGDAGPWELFVSAYEDSERVKTPFTRIQADCKQWFVQDQYDVPKNQEPSDAITMDASFDSPAVKFVQDKIQQLGSGKLCIDSTGFIRPHLLVLLKAIKDKGVREFDVLYSDPVRYTHDEDTPFTLGSVTSVKQVPGYEGVHRPSARPFDILVIGAGYDVDQIAKTCDERRYVKKYLLTGLPSLQPHMYQESVLQIYKASESIGDLPDRQRLFAPANQPFGVAQELQNLVTREKAEAQARRQAPPNFYLCPIGPKPHALGFAIYFLRECESESVSIIYPFVTKFPRSTTEGLMRTWEYNIEL